MTAESEFLFRALYEDILRINASTGSEPIETDLSIQDRVVSIVDRYSRKEIEFEDYKNALVEMNVYPAHPSFSESEYLGARLLGSVLYAASISNNVFPVCNESLRKIKVAIGHYSTRSISFEDFKRYVEDLQVLHPLYFGTNRVQ